MSNSEEQYQNFKNKKRLIHQNIKLRQQVMKIQTQFDLINNDQSSQHQNQNNQIPNYNQYIQEIVIQEKLMRQLRARIQLFKLERAKDNVEYIVRQQDELKIMKAFRENLIDQKAVLTRRKQDKNNKLQNNLPYQNYQENFLEGLTTIVHHNRDQAAKITQIQRQIRKYHLLVKQKRVSSDKKSTLHQQPNNLSIIQAEIQSKKQLKKAMEDKWKPHFQLLDQQYSRLLYQLSKKKNQMQEVQRQQRCWDTKIGSFRDLQNRNNDKKRLQLVKVNIKLKQQLQNSILMQQQRKKKKVNIEELKYQFTKPVKQEQQKPKEEAKKKEEFKKKEEIVSFVKKVQQKITVTMHDDKNITKKVEKLTKQTKKPPPIKTDQTHNTDLSIPVQKKRLNKKASITEDFNPIEYKYKTGDQQKAQRHWQYNPQSKVTKDAGKFKQQKTQNKDSEIKIQKIGVKLQDNKDLKSVLHLREISIQTDNHLWKEQNRQREEIAKT